MSYSACDLQSQLREELEKAGYKFHEVADEHAWYWQLGDTDVMGGHMDSETQAEADAMCHLFAQMNHLQVAAAVVVGNWETNRLASSVQALQGALDSTLPGDVEHFIQKATQ